MSLWVGHCIYSLRFVDILWLGWKIYSNLGRSSCENSRFHLIACSCYSHTTSKHICCYINENYCCLWQIGYAINSNPLFNIELVVGYMLLIERHTEHVDVTFIGRHMFITRKGVCMVLVAAKKISHFIHWVIFVWLPDHLRVLQDFTH